jgi:hypothetical protein
VVCPRPASSWCSRANGRRASAAPLTSRRSATCPWSARSSSRSGSFVFSTILGWAYYGEKACEYLFGTGSIVVYRVLWVIAVMVGSVAPLPVVWSAADITNALMAIPNLISLLVLTHVIVDETRTHLWSEDGSER